MREILGALLFGGWLLILLLTFPLWLPFLLLVSWWLSGYRARRQVDPAGVRTVARFQGSRYESQEIDRGDATHDEGQIPDDVAEGVELFRILCDRLTAAGLGPAATESYEWAHTAYFQQGRLHFYLGRVDGWRVHVEGGEHSWKDCFATILGRDLLAPPDTPELRALLTGLDRCLREIPGIDGVRWLPRERSDHPESGQPTPLDAAP